MKKCYYCGSDKLYYEFDIEDVKTTRCFYQREECDKHGYFICDSDGNDISNNGDEENLMKTYYAQMPVITYIDVEITANSEAEAKDKLGNLDFEYWYYAEDNLVDMVANYENMIGYDNDNMAIVEGD